MKALRWSHLLLHTRKHTCERDTKDVQTVEKKVSIEVHILLNIRIASHTLKLMEIMPYNSIAHKTLFEITRGLLLALGFCQLLI